MSQLVEPRSHGHEPPGPARPALLTRLREPNKSRSTRDLPFPLRLTRALLLRQLEARHGPYYEWSFMKEGRQVYLIQAEEDRKRKS